MITSSQRIFPNARAVIASLMALVAVTGCSDDEPSEDETGNLDVTSTGLGTSSDSGAEASTTGEIPSLGPAIMLATYVRSPDGNDSVYVKALPEVPTGELEYSDYREFGAVNVLTHDGSVYVWDGEAATMTRFSVSESLELVEGPELSLINEGFSGIDAHSHAFISPTRAYAMSPQLDQVIVWNPEIMEITGTIAMQAPVRPEAMSTGVHYPIVRGDQVIWRLVSANWTTLELFPATTLAVASATGDTPVQIVEDGRCAAGYDGAFLDDAGDLYLQGGAHWGSFDAFGPNPGGLTTCMLRIKAGETAFDPEFTLDYQTVTGSPYSRPWFNVTGTKYLASVWDPARPLPADSSTWYQDNTFLPLLVDVATGQTAPYPALSNTVLISSLPFRVDGVSYYQMSSTGYGVGTAVDVVELHETGVVNRFRAPGELWAIGRIR